MPQTVRPPRSSVIPDLVMTSPSPAHGDPALATSAVSVVECVIESPHPGSAACATPASETTSRHTTTAMHALPVTRTSLRRRVQTRSFSEGVDLPEDLVGEIGDVRHELAA